jgi:hypothetical protein
MKLQIEYLNELLTNNRYPVNSEKSLISRDICGKYTNQVDLPALSVPGGDLGELIVILAAANSYGYEVKLDTYLPILIELIGGEMNFSYHNEGKNTPNLANISCNYIEQICQKFSEYSLTQENITAIEQKLSTIKTDHPSKYPQIDDVSEEAVLIINGPYGVYPRFSFQTDNGIVSGSLYIFHRSLADARHKALAKKLFESKAVSLFEGCDEEYLYHTLTETMDTHFFQTISMVTKELPIYTVTFANDGSFTIAQE